MKRGYDKSRSVARRVAAAADNIVDPQAFAMWSLAPLISEHLGGTCASGLWEVLAQAF